MATFDLRLSPGFYLLPQINRRRHGLRSEPRVGLKGLNLARIGRPAPVLLRRSLAVSCRAASDGEAREARDEDFVARVLKENPSQVEPRYLVGDKFYTLKERENLGKGSGNAILDYLLERLNSAPRSKKVVGESRSGNEVKDDVYLKDILREYKGKLYVPEQVFGTRLSEEEEFKKRYGALPKMSVEDFYKAMKSDKVKMLTWNEVTSVRSGNGYRDFIVELKEIPGDKSLQRRRWAMRLDEDKARTEIDDNFDTKDRYRRCIFNPMDFNCHP